MTRRYLFGPIAASYAADYLIDERRAGDCLGFNAAGDLDVRAGWCDSWADVVKQFPANWQPDFVVLYLPYAGVPPCFWDAPIPVIAWAPDWNLLWHYYRVQLASAELILTDAPGVEALHREGLTHARTVNLFGLGRSFLEHPWPDGPRDIDVLFVGNLHPAVQRERLAWLGRLAKLGRRWRVAIHGGCYGDDYRRLLARARVVFNRSIRGECNMRAFEAVAGGALLFQEAGNRELPQYLADGRECVYYHEGDLEELLERYLSNESERTALAEAARVKLPSFHFTANWQAALAKEIEPHLPELTRHAAARSRPQGAEALLNRTWQLLCSAEVVDQMLAADLSAYLAAEPNCGALHNALGLVVTRTSPCKAAGTPHPAEAAVGHFRKVVLVEPDNVLAALNAAEALTQLGQTEQAAAAVRQGLAALERAPQLSAAVCASAHYPPVFDVFRVEWERAAALHAGDGAGEAQAKARLLRWRLQELLAELIDHLNDYYSAHLSRSDLPATQAALGCALARAGQFGVAAGHLEQALEKNPFDRETAQFLWQCYGDRPADQQRLADERLLLNRAAPGAVPLERWFAESAKPPAAAGAVVVHSIPGAGAPPPEARLPEARRSRVSLCLIVKNEEHNLADCLKSVVDLVDEVVLVDTGSTDATREIAAQLGARVFEFPWIDSFAAARNESLRRATGDWVFWMDADDRLDEENRGRLRALLARLPDGNAAFVMKCLCLPDPIHGTTTVVDHVRLFRNHPEVRWSYRVHEQILPALRRQDAAVHWSDVVVQHVGYQDPALRARKLQRDLRLLALENDENPDDPFTLFNLGSVHQELGEPAQALLHLRRSLERSQSTDSIVRKLYALISQCHRQLGQDDQALAACHEGRRHYPQDAELLFHEAIIRRDRGDDAGAEGCLLRLLATDEGKHFASVDASLRGYKARHNLAVIYREQGRRPEAEAQWQWALQENPAFDPAWVGLGNLYVEQARWDDVEQIAGELGRRDRAMEAAVLRGRSLLVRGDFAAARRQLGEAVRRFPHALWARRVLSHALLQEGLDWDAAEQALLDLLALAPDDREAQHNLAVLRQQQSSQPAPS